MLTMSHPLPAVHFLYHRFMHPIIHAVIFFYAGQPLVVDPASLSTDNSSAHGKSR